MGDVPEKRCVLDTRCRRRTRQAPTGYFLASGAGPAVVRRERIPCERGIAGIGPSSGTRTWMGGRGSQGTLVASLRSKGPDDGAQLRHDDDGSGGVLCIASNIGGSPSESGILRSEEHTS